MTVNNSPEKSVIPPVIIGLILIITPCTASLQVQTSTNIAFARGDPLTITGTGFMNGSAAIWGIGPSFFTYGVIPAAPDGAIDWILGRDAPRSFRSGPLVVIVQDPGGDRQYPLRAAMSAGKNRIAWENGTGIFEGEPGSMSIPAAMDLANEVGDGITGGGTDDSCTLVVVMVEEPSIHFRQGNLDGFPTVAAGESIRFSGTTNSAPENRITARVEDTAAIGKTGSPKPVRAGGITIVRTGELQNRWDYTPDTSGLRPGEYQVEIGRDQSAVSGQAAMIFRITRQPDTASGTPHHESGKTTRGLSLTHSFSPSASAGLPQLDEEYFMRSFS